ncbi:UNKNOWN [Stylonychia lemnae]|uniref:Uncharacterized protein n=1 Tax=Stylonychia lemnae TaxID=5949 RepID=A0A078ABU5_STYLE|nr:UNKNOWN [Stylonychia lemnae]|eukprot:CDW79331.1 UNKNOWN [Stylonychia lemnae]
MDLSQVLYVGTISTFTSEAPITTSFSKNIGWLMNINPSEIQQKQYDMFLKHQPMQSHISNVSGFVTFAASTREFTVFTSNQEYNGIYTLKMLGRINNEQRTEVSFKLIMIGACSYASITSTQQSDITYTLNSGLQNFTLNAFNANTTGCSITYTLSDASASHNFNSNLTQTSVPNLFTFDQTSMVISSNPTLSSQIGTYNLSLVGILLYPLSDGEINPKNGTVYIKFYSEWWEKLFD